MPVHFADQLVVATPAAGDVAAPDVVPRWRRCGSAPGVPVSAGVVVVRRGQAVAGRAGARYDCPAAEAPARARDARRVGDVDAGTRAALMPWYGVTGSGEFTARAAAALCHRVRAAAVTDHRDRTGAGGDRQDRVGVLQQHSALRPRPARGRRCARCWSPRCRRAGLRVVEQPGLEHRGQDPADVVVDGRLRHLAVADRGGQRGAVVGAVRHLHVEAVVGRRDSGVGGAPVGGDEAGEAPLA